MAIFEKQALVIGNDAYVHQNKLNACVYDAKTLTRSLRSIGFNVKTGIDCRKDEMHAIIHQFAQSVRPGAIVLFYFSGHGFQFDGDNFLPATDTKFTDAPIAQNVLKEMHRNKPRVVIFILDCCRSRIPVPYTELRAHLVDGRTTRRDGLAPMGGPPSTIIAYACAADTESFAASGTRPNSMYTHYLLRYITTPNVDIDMVLKNVAVEVQRESVNEQVPFLYTNCNERICLNANPWPNIPVWPGAVQFNPLLLAFDQHRRRKQHVDHNIRRQISSYPNHFNSHFGMPNNKYLHQRNPLSGAIKFPFRHA